MKFSGLISSLGIFLLMVMRTEVVDAARAGEDCVKDSQCDDRGYSCDDFTRTCQVKTVDEGPEGQGQGNGNNGNQQQQGNFPLILQKLLDALIAVKTGN